jgi:hypothetical protein
MSTDKTYRDFKFKSSLVATNLTRCLGLALIFGSIDFFEGWLNPSWDRLPFMILLLPFGLSIWAVGGMFLLSTCDTEILDGQFRFRRFFVWKSVPLESITKIRLLWAPGIYLRIDHAGRRFRLIFNPEDFKARPSPLPVIKFLRERAGWRRPSEACDPVPSHDVR